MLVQQVEVLVRDGDEVAFEGALCEVRQRIFMSPGFRGFSVAQGADHPAAYLVHVRWETAEELLAFSESDRFERCWAPVQAFVAGGLRVSHLVERPSLAFQGPGVLTDVEWLSR
jgi:heme-degrading monooxygenase HmoA